MTEKTPGGLFSYFDGFRAALSFASLTVLMTCGSAQAAWPDRPIKLVVGFAAGGPTDIYARMLAKQLSEQMSQKVLVENKPGANANIAAEAVVREPADGYTFLFNTTSLPISAGLYAKLNYDPRKDLVPVARVMAFPLLVVASMKFGPSNPVEFAEYLRANPNKTNYSSGGVGNTQHLGMEMLLKRIDAKATHIAYKGTAQAVVDIISGDIQYQISGIAPVASYLDAKQLKPIAALSLKRLAKFPNVATFNESGYPGFEIDAWYGVMAATGTPTSIVNDMSKQIEVAMKSEAITKWLVEQDGYATYADPADYKTFLDSEFTRYKQIITDLGLKQE